MAEHAIYVKGHFVFKTIRERSIVELIPFKWIERHLEKVYTKAYNQAADVFNKYIDKWNEEFDKKYPDKDGDSIEYNAYICRCANKVMKRLDTPFGPIVRYELDDKGRAVENIYYMGYSLDYVWDEWSVVD